MYTQYVILNKTEKRIFISSKQLVNDNYYLLFESSSTDYQSSMFLCKAFCLGYIHGNKGVQIVNEMDEFNS